MSSHKLAHGAAQIRNVELDRVNFSRELLLPLRLVGAERVHIRRVFIWIGHSSYFGYGSGF
ncbi:MULTISPECIES: hypothetical protein [Bradyrhizobium]|uniref:Uncharacterized protein n=3 Tax=Bradyrhizobium TaxID=374 RepID=A0A974AG02_9BRAD|nr:MULTISPECIES: hypothetical protein [Bradyrhizobium]UGA44438.1 hypothetical protein HU230_0041215 [Bradyrhizobium quebecense]UGY00649.1 hypothetical protein J4P68_0026280 [Bradyrhizobium quebecense]UPT88795.1 hypothetical protein HAP41_0000007135 [Bradyrhizobium barranii subsp. apii]UPT96089.1 hypothetical protein J4G48_0044740 [Bradyrhizobium barranii subsp. apii]